MKVLSLFDGGATAYYVMLLLGIDVERYVAFEIDPKPLAVSKSRVPIIEYGGDVFDFNKDEWGNFDILLGGSSCQDLSAAMKDRTGLAGSKSSSFFQYVSILDQVNPKWFFFENVGSMRDDDEAIISELLKCNPIKLNSKRFSPALRNRYYWTNVPQLEYEDNDIKLQDIIEDGWVTDRKKARSLLVSDSRPLKTPVKMLHRYFKTGFTTLLFKSKKDMKEVMEHYFKHFGNLSAKQIDEKLENEDIDLSLYEGKIRYMNQRELELCMNLPYGWTSALNRNGAAHVLGNGWEAETIYQLLKYLKED